MNENPSPLIISRTYQLGEDRSVILYVFKPELVDDDAVCHFSITGLAKEIKSHAFGIDEIQATLLALTKAASFLYTSDEYKSGQLKWLGSADLGLPTAASIQELFELK